MHYPTLLLALVLLLGGCARDHDDAHSPDHAGFGEAEPAALEEKLEPHDLDLENALTEYVVVHQYLVDDHIDGARAASERLAAILSEMAHDAPLHGRRLAAAGSHADALAHAASLHEAREHFGELNAEFVPLVAAAESHEASGLYRVVCGMTEAPEKGTWLQRHEEVRNPYFGSAMLRCASSVEPLYAPVTG